jgi:cyclic-di-AMP phosphodiesterase PgpH
MKNNLLKMSLLPLAIGFCIFIFIFLAEIINSVFSVGFIFRIIDLLIIALLLGILISNGLFIIIPKLKDSILLSRSNSRLESFSHPLLMRLSYEAPGTFHHSINVSILAQKAAKAISGDSLLVRLGGYYHDIGKLESPNKYIENQSGTEIPRREDAEYIRKETIRIISHVEKGLAIATEYHLPEEIVNLIAEHHGTTKVVYFYEKAKENGLKIKKTDFRYKGPTPQSKEALILMLADSCEAAARAFPYLNEEMVKKIVDDTIKDRISDGQTRNVIISSNDLSKISQSLAETLLSINHQRILP